MISGHLSLESLLALPTLFVQETAGQPGRLARVGRITQLRRDDREAVIEYSFETGTPPITNELLLRFAGELDISNSELETTHWAVKEPDLYRFLFRNVQARRLRPNVFQVSELENIEPSLISAMMPFSPEFGRVYTALQQTAIEAGLRCRRADDIWENPFVIQDVVSLIDKSSIVICDCTGRNPNVFYEIGIAHTLGREVILITQAPNDVPFDLRHLRFVQYLNNGEGLQQLQATLLPRLQALAASRI